MEQVRTNGEQKELRDEIVELGTRYGIVTPYTSYLATDGSERDDRPRPMPLQSGAIQDMDALGGASRSANKVLNAPSGEVAVKSSKDAKAKKEAEKFDKQTSASVQNV